MAKDKAVSGARRTLVWLAILFVALGAVLTSGVLTNQTTWAPKLALDLEGGTQMILSPQTSDNTEIDEDQLNQAVEIIRQRVDGSGTTEAEISTQGARNVIVSLPGIPDAQTRELIQASANLTFRSVLEVGAPQVIPPAEAEANAPQPPTAAPQNPSDPNWITPEVYKAFAAKDCTLEAVQQPQEDAPNPAVPTVACDVDGQAKYILGPVENTGTQIDSATFGQATNSQGQNTGQWEVQLNFDGEGTEIFREATTRLVALPSPRNQFAIILDGRVISAPRSEAAIQNGRSAISGNFTRESAQALSEQLRYGALPISFQIESEQQISATLGNQQLQMGIIAGVIGLLLVCVYSFFQYRLLAWVTIISLVMAGILTYFSITILGWTANYRLSLAGVAGLIVAIGQTADSFIVYFERIRDELREGRTAAAAIDHGWARAKRTVLASKAVSLLAAVVLYLVAVGNVRGFAFTLGLTAIADLIIVFLFTHPVMVLLARTKFFGGGHKWSGMDPTALGREPFYKGAGRFRAPSAARTPAAAGASASSSVNGSGPGSRGSSEGASSSINTISNGERIMTSASGAGSKKKSAKPKRNGSSSSSGGSGKNGEGRMTIAERRAAAAGKTLNGDSAASNGSDAADTAIDPDLEPSSSRSGGSSGTDLTADDNAGEQR